MAIATSSKTSAASAGSPAGGLNSPYGGSLVHLIVSDARAAERAVLDRTTIAQLAEQCSPVEWVI